MDQEKEKEQKNQPAWKMTSVSGKSEIHAVIAACDGAFENPVTQRSIYPGLLEKISQKGSVIAAYQKNQKNPLGYCAFYANDTEQKNAYISLIAVAPKYQEMHVGTKLLNEAFSVMRSCGMEHCFLEVRKNNDSAIRFYQRNQFVTAEERAESYLMKCEL